MPGTEELRKGKADKAIRADDNLGNFKSGNADNSGLMRNFAYCPEWKYDISGRHKPQNITTPTEYELH